MHERKPKPIFFTVHITFYDDGTCDTSIQYHQAVSWIPGRWWWSSRVSAIIVGPTEMHTGQWMSVPEATEGYVRYMNQHILAP